MMDVLNMVDVTNNKAPIVALCSTDYRSRLLVEPKGADLYQTI